MEEREAKTGVPYPYYDDLYREVMSTMEGSQAYAEATGLTLDEDGYPPGFGASGQERKTKRETSLANMQQRSASEKASRETEAERGKWEGDATGQTSSNISTGDAEYDELASKFEGVVGRDERGYLEQPSEPVFSDGAVLVPGSDPFSIDEIVRDGFDGMDPTPLIRQYEAETGNSISDENFVTDKYTGPLNYQSVIDHMWDQGYGGQTYAQTLETPAEYELDPSYENLADEVGSFFDWFASKDTSETQKMAKMMQTYNVDNKRRDPIILSNRGGRQR